MTKEGRLARGKENYEAKRFLDNLETVAYVCVLNGGVWDDKEQKCISKGKPKEIKDVKSNK